MPPIPLPLPSRIGRIANRSNSKSRGMARGGINPESRKIFKYSCKLSASVSFCHFLRIFVFEGAGSTGRPTCGGHEVQRARLSTQTRAGARHLGASSRSPRPLLPAAMITAASNRLGTVFVSGGGCSALAWNLPQAWMWAPLIWPH